MALPEFVPGSTRQPITPMPLAPFRVPFFSMPDMTLMGMQPALLKTAQLSAHISPNCARAGCAETKNNGDEILEEPGLFRPGEVMRDLKIAQLRRTAQNEIHRREEQLGEYETGGRGQ